MAQDILSRLTSHPSAPAAGFLSSYPLGASDAAALWYIQRPDATKLTVATLEGAQVFTGAITIGGLLTANAGISVPTGQAVTGAGTASISGFKSGSFGTAGNAGTLALLGTTSGTATFSVDATTTTVTLDKAFTAGAISGTTGAFSGIVTLNTTQLFSSKLSILYTGVSQNGIAIQTSDNTANAGFIEFVNDTAGVIGSIYRNVQTNAVIYSITSDYRTKETFGPFLDAVKILSNLKIYDAIRKGDPRHQPLLLAHEAQPIVPWAITGEKDAVDKNNLPIYQSRAVGSFEELLISGWQNHEQRLQQQQAQINELRGRMQ